MAAGNQIITALLLCQLLVSCGRGTKQNGDYIAWVENEDNGLVVKKEIEGIEYNLLYKPHDYIVAKEYTTQAIGKNQVEQRRKELGAMQYFTLKIKSAGDKELLRAGIRSEDEYYARLEYFMSGMQSDLYLVEGKDTLPCLMQHYERTYGMSPWNNFVLGFDNPAAGTKEDKLLVYDDKVLGTGKIMMKIKAEDIEEAPELTLR